MRTLLASLLLASVALAAPGCIFGCGGYSGGGDQVYARGSDQLILCENGGFVADVGASTIEGFYTDNPAGSTVAVTGTEGDNGAHAFDLSDNSDGTASIPQFGTDAWTKVTLNQTGLDHANTLCQNLETRAWWTSGN